ncbi:zinc-dependent metalloprotease, partial [Nakamurella sp.]|uniref:zinc-dependent metalloprotease n=1 Tax=Nakamurella sp. TaxID=1869182 RepID=UPI003B3ABDB3
PRRLRAAAELWQAVSESRGTDGRDALWADPGLLPSGKDLDDPKGFVERDKQFTELLAGLDDIETQLLGKPGSDPEAGGPAGSPDAPPADRPDEEPPTREV